MHEVHTQPGKKKRCSSTPIHFIINKILLRACSHLLIILVSVHLSHPQECEFIKKATFGKKIENEEMLYNISDAQSDESGNIFVLDSIGNCVKKYSKNLHLVKESGKKGQGPGDLNSPLALVFHRNGEIYVNDYGNRRLCVYDKDLNFLRSIFLTKTMAVEDLFFDLNDHLVIFRSPRIIGENYFNIFMKEGIYIDSFYNEMHQFAPRMESLKQLKDNLGSFIYFFGKAAMTHNGDRLAFTYDLPYNPYHIVILDIEGKQISTIKGKVKNYDPKKQKSYLEHIVLKTNKVTAPIFMASKLLFTSRGDLIIQFRKDDYQDGSLARSEYFVDIYDAKGTLLCGGKKLDAEMLFIDKDNNVFARTEDHSECVIYELRIGHH